MPGSLGTGSDVARQSLIVQQRGLPGEKAGELGHVAKVRRHARRSVNPELFREFERVIEDLEAECEAKRADYYQAAAEHDAGRGDKQLAEWWLRVTFESWHELRWFIAEVARIEAKWHQENALRKTLNSERLWNAELE